MGSFDFFWGLKDSLLTEMDYQLYWIKNGPGILNVRLADKKPVIFSF